eukprot:Gb_19083 [translate_table: standard]
MYHRGDGGNSPLKKSDDGDKGDEGSVSWQLQAFQEAILDVDKLDDDSLKESTLIMQLISDNVAIWTSNMPEGGGASNSQRMEGDFMGLPQEMIKHMEIWLVLILGQRFCWSKVVSELSARVDPGMKLSISCKQFDCAAHQFSDLDAREHTVSLRTKFGWICAISCLIGNLLGEAIAPKQRGKENLPIKDFEAILTFDVAWSLEGLFEKALSNKFFQKGLPSSHFTQHQRASVLADAMANLGSKWERGKTKGRQVLGLNLSPLEISPSGSKILRNCREASMGTLMAFDIKEETQEAGSRLIGGVLKHPFPIGREVSNLKEAVQSLSKMRIHVLYELAHQNSHQEQQQGPHFLSGKWRLVENTHGSGIANYYA